MEGDVDPCLRVGVLSASSLPRSGGGTEASSWVVEAKILKQDQQASDEEPYRTKPSRMGTWNEELALPLDTGEAQSGILRLYVLDATLREKGLKVHMGHNVRLRVSIFVALEDPMVKIQHIVHLEALLLTFPEGMPLPGVRREAGAAVKSFVQCIPKGMEGDVSLRNSKRKEPPTQRCDAAGEEAIKLEALKADHNGDNSYLRSTVPVTIVDDQVAWDESISFPIGPRVKNSYMSHTRAYPRQLYGKEQDRDTSQVSFLVSFFLVEASSQSSTALGFAVMEIPDDIRLSDGGAELSANVTSPEGTPMEDVECVVDIKVSGPPPGSPRGSDAPSMDDDDDKSDATTRSLDGSKHGVESLSESRSEPLSESGSNSRTTTSESRRTSTKNAEARRKSIERQTAVHAAAEKELQIVSLKDQLQAAYEQADRKQTVVDNLSDQVDKRSDAIRKCGAEIVKLRKNIEDIDQERCRLRSQLKTLHRTTAEAEMEANRVMKSMEGEGGSAGGVIGDTGGRHTRALAKRCIVLTEENRALRRVAQDCAHERWQTAVLKSEMEKMKKTQHMQAVYIRKMQALPGKVSAYKSTVAMQEKVIAKLEKLMAGRRSGNSGSTSGGEDSSVGGGQRGKDSEIERLRKENASLRWRLAMGGTQTGNQQAADYASATMKMKDSKIRILEEQMVANAKASGDEIAALQMRVMEMEFEIGDS